MLEIWLRYDLRSPLSIGLDSVSLAAAAIDQVAWADRHGFHTVQLPEHHGSEDRYNPSPLILAAAMASRTSIMRLQPSAIILPLHDPIRIAEDCAMVDIISNGRLDVTVGTGYVPSEFDMFGIDLAERGNLVESKLAALKQAFTGERFVYEGRNVQVMPKPVQDGGPPIFIGGSIKATARRAAQFDCGYYPMTPKHVPDYYAYCEEFGRTPKRVLQTIGPRLVHISRDPDEAWAKIGPHALYETNAYAEFAEKLGQVTNFKRAENTEALRTTGQYRVMTPEEGLAFFRKQRDDGHYVTLAPLVAGLDPEVSWESLQLIGTEIIPALQNDEKAASVAAS